MGCDPSQRDCLVSSFVSIHAPVWGATTCLQGAKDKTWFQSTHPCGVRPSIFIIRSPRQMFQSTHPCGVRRRDDDEYRQEFNVSIHAPVWGATVYVVKTTGVIKFQSTHPCGVRHPALVARLTLCSFNPRTRVGCDNTRLRCFGSAERFNPRTRVGCDKRRSSCSS